eukprot:scaffold3103_cov136-Cylindrotheca_fusiformis.AAC.4
MLDPAHSLSFHLASRISFVHILLPGSQSKLGSEFSRLTVAQKVLSNFEAAAERMCQNESATASVLINTQVVEKRSNS